jgi:putative sporulation protein YtxC
LILLSVGYSRNNSILYDKLRELCDYIRIKGSNIAIVESDISNMHYLKCVLKDTEPDLKNFENCREIFYSYCANIIYSFIAMEYETEMVEKMIIDKYNYLELEDMKEVTDRCKAVISGNGMNTAQGLVFNVSRRNNILKRIEDFLYESSEMILDGFVTFRLKDTINELDEVVDKIIEDYVMEKEYSEFIKLLKYFVEIQESRYDSVNIYILRQGEFKIEDSSLRDITLEFFEDFGSDALGSDASRQDMLISALITNAPKNIVIHGQENEELCELIDTIKSIFVERVIICKGCQRCKILLDQHY